MTTLSPYVFRQELDNNGNPLSGGKIYTYEAGTTTPKATYTDSTGNTANANPVILDSAGRASIWLGDGGYKFVLKTSADVTISTVDNIGGSSDTAFGGEVNTLSSNTIINSTYQNSANICTNTIALSLLAVADAGEGFYFTVKNQGSGVITIDPDTTEQIDGASSITIAAGLSAVIICDGSTWYSLFLDKVTLTGTNAFTGVNTFSNSSNTYAGTWQGNAVAEQYGGTGKSSYTAGDTLYASGTTTLTKLAIGAAGRPLVSSGTAPAWGNAISLQTTVNVNTGTSVTLTSSIPSGVREIIIDCENISFTGLESLQLDLNSETSGYVCGSSVFSGTTAYANYTNAFRFRMAAAAANGFYGRFRLTLMDAATNKWSCEGSGHNTVDSSTILVGTKSLSGALTTLRLNGAGGGTFDGSGIATVSWRF